MTKSPYQRQAVFAAACMGMLVFGTFLTTLGSILPLIIERFGVDKGQAGSLLLFMNLGVLAGSLVFGPVVDRYGFKAMLIASSVVTLVGIEGVAFAPTFGSLRVAVFVSGLAGGVINGGTNALVADLSTAGRGAGLSLLGIFFGLGAFGVPFAMSFLLDRFTYSEVVGGVGATVMMPLIFFAAIRFPAPKQPRGFPIRKGMGIVKEPAMLVVGVMLLLQSGIEITAGGWSAAYFVEELALEPREAVLLLSFFWIGLTAGRWAVGTLFKEVDPFSVLVVSIATGVVGSILVLFSSTAITAGLGIFVAGLGFAAIFPYLLGFVGDLFPDISGTAFGIAFVMALIGGTSFPYIVGVVGEHVGLRVAFIVITASLLLNAGLLFRVKRHLRTRS